MVKLRITKCGGGAPRHTDAVTASVWVTPSGGGGVAAGLTRAVLLVAGDDGLLTQWNGEGEYVGTVATWGECAVIDAATCPASPDTVAFACSDGTLRIWQFTRPVTGSSVAGGGSNGGDGLVVGREEKRAVTTAATAPPPPVAVAGGGGAAALRGAVGTGATMCVRWNVDGSALVTGSEDGCVKVFSRAGLLRTTLVSAGRPVYCVSWSPDGASVAYGAGKNVTLVALTGEGAGGGGAGVVAGGTLPAQPGAAGVGAGRGRVVTWKAHDQVVTKCDWSGVTGTVVTGGEDGRYKVWDALGHCLYASTPGDASITALAWSPRGDVFAVGSYSSLRICGDNGWCLAQEQGSAGVGSDIPGSPTDRGGGGHRVTPLGLADPCGSVCSVAWTGDGTGVACGTGSGHVLMAALLHRQWTHGTVTATLTAPDKLTVVDHGASGGAGVSEGSGGEEVDLHDPIVAVGVGWGHLVAATATHISVHAAPSWGSPHSVDTPKAAARLITQCARSFAVVDSSGYVGVYGYDARLISNPKLPHPLRVDCLHPHAVALSPDAIAIVDRGGPDGGRVVRCFDVRNGRQLGGTITHSCPIVQVGLSQGGGGLPDRRLVLLDASHDVYITPVVRSAPTKLAAMIDSVAWNDTCDQLCMLADGSCTTWLVPAAVAWDADLCALAKLASDASLVRAFGAGAVIAGFAGPRLTVRRSDGTLIHATVSHYGPLLHECVAAGKWAEAIRLARFVGEESMWAALAALSLSVKHHLDTAEVALAALKAVDKLAWVTHVKGLPLVEMRNAEMAVYRHVPEEGEAILLQSTPPLLYRAVKLNVRLARWERALQLAQQHHAHVDTVLLYRQRLLESLKRAEHLESFIKAGAAVGRLDEKGIQDRKMAEKEAERRRAAAVGPVLTVAGGRASAGAGGGSVSRPGATAADAPPASVDGGVGRHADVAYEGKDDMGVDDIDML